MRPGTIIWFELLYLGSLVVGVVRLAFNWDEVVVASEETLTLGVLVFALAINLALILFVSRRRSRIAVWLLVVLFLFGLSSYVPLIWTPLVVEDVVDILLGLAQVLAIALLFSPSARAWLAAPNAPMPSAAALERTFE